MRPGLLIVLLVSTTALAHPKGFHKIDQAVIHPRKVEVLVRMDLDSGAKAQFLRRNADTDHDGRIDAAEAQALKAQLIDLVRRPLYVTLSGYVLQLEPKDAKLGLREDRRANETGVSIAVLFESTLPQPVFSGMELVIEDQSPDASHVRVEAEQDVGVDGDSGPYAQADLQPGERLSLRLQGAM